MIFIKFMLLCSLNVYLNDSAVYTTLNYTKYTKLSQLNLELNGYSGGLPCSSLDNKQGWPCGGVFCVDDVPACHWGARCPSAAEPSGSAAVIVAQHPVGEAWPVCQSKNSLHGNSKARPDLAIRKELNWNALSGTLTVPGMSLTMVDGEGIDRSSVLQGFAQVSQEVAERVGSLQTLQNHHNTTPSAAFMQRHQEPWYTQHKNKMFWSCF